MRQRRQCKRGKSDPDRARLARHPLSQRHRAARTGAQGAPGVHRPVRKVCPEQDRHPVYCGLPATRHSRKSAASPRANRSRRRHATSCSSFRRTRNDCSPGCSKARPRQRRKWSPRALAKQGPNRPRQFRSRRPRLAVDAPAGVQCRGRARGLFSRSPESPRQTEHPPRSRWPAGEPGGQRSPPLQRV